MIGRIKEFIDLKGLSVSAFEQSIEASDGMIRRAIKNGTDIQSKWISRISDKYHDINLEWLITGRGPMLRDERSAPVVSPPDLERENMALKEVIAEKNTEIRQLNREIGSLEEKLGARGQGASPRFYSARKSDEPNVPDVSGTHDNPHVAPAIPPKRDGRQTARK